VNRLALVLTVSLIALPAAPRAQWSLFGSGGPGEGIPHLEDWRFELDVSAMLLAEPDVARETRVEVTRFGDTILLTGEAPSATLRERVDSLVLKQAGLKRPVAGGSRAVADRTQGCGGKQGAANARRRFNLGANRPCSPVVEDEQEAGFHNQIRIRPPKSASERAADELLAAQIRRRLAVHGYAGVMDPERLRLVVQDASVYLLGVVDAEEDKRLAAAIGAMSGVGEVFIYPASRSPAR